MRAAINVEILRQPPRVGAHQYLYQLIASMDPLLDDGELVLLNNSFRRGADQRPELPPTKNDRIKYVNIKISKKLLLKTQAAVGLPRLEHLIGELDIYHEPAHNELRATRAKKIITIHDLSPLTGLYTPPDYTEYMKNYFAATAHWADAVIADSEATRRDVIEKLGISEDRVVRIYLAAHGASGMIEDRDSVRELCGRLGLDREFFLYVGTIEPKKNLVNIIKAYNAFRADRKDAPMLALTGGRGWLSDDVFTEANISPYSGDIVFTGYVGDDDISCLMNGALAFVYPSRFEGFGLPVIEAMACGVPVITSNVTSLPEVAGDAALLVSPDDVEAIAHSLRRITDEPSLRDDLIKKGFVQNSKFSWEQTARETLDLYRSLTD